MFVNRKDLIDPSGLSEEQLKEIPYKKVEWVKQNCPMKTRANLHFFYLHETSYHINYLAYPKKC